MQPKGPGTVAVVDDEAVILETVGFALRREGYQVECYADGLSAWERFQLALPDVVVLDIKLPRMDGLELCRRLRTRSEALPIIFLSSRDEEFDRVLGLELGADDYLCKPFSVRELLARVRALLRRARQRRAPAGGPDEKIVAVGPLRLDLGRCEARWNGTRVALTLTEFTLLEALARHPGFVKTREQLMKEGYPHDVYVSERTIDTHVKRLRRKLADAAPGADPVETVYGVGYRLRESQ